MFGMGIALTVVIVLIVIGHRHDGISTGIMWFGIFIGLLIASVIPGLPNTVHDTVSNVIQDVSNTQTHK